MCSVICYQAWGDALNSSPAWWPVNDVVGFDHYMDGAY